VPSTRFTFHSFFVLAHRPVTSAYPDACGYQKPPDHNTFIHSDPRRTGMCRTFLFPVLESHCASIVASARPQHAPCGLPFDHHMLCPCNERVTSALLTDCSSSGPLIHNILFGRLSAFSTCFFDRSPRTRSHLPFETLLACAGSPFCVQVAGSDQLCDAVAAKDNNTTCS